MEAKIIDRFTPELVKAICLCIQPVSDRCLAQGLISDSTRSHILELSIVTNEDKTRKLLEDVKKLIKINSVSFDIFLRILKEELPESGRAELLTAMRAELTNEQAAALATSVDGCTALVPTFQIGHGTVSTALDRQLSVPYVHDAQRLLRQEQNPYIGLYEGTIRQQERIVAEMNTLKDKLEESERSRAQLAKIGQSLLSLTNAGESHQSTTSSTFEVDIIQLKGKIEKLEKDSRELGMEIRLYRCAIDVKGEEITEKLLKAHEKIELQYKQKIQMLEEFMMNRDFIRETQRYNSREESFSGEGFDYDVPVSKKKKIKFKSGVDKKADDDDTVHCKCLT